MLDRLRRRGGDEHGVVLVLVAIMLTAFLGMAALAIDLGSFYGAQRKAQAAADAGALAAAGNLATSNAAALSAGTTYATTNDPGATATVSTPYNGSTTQAKVTVNTTTPSFFGQIFGITKANISATAVASATPGSTPAPPMFAMGTTCGNNSQGFGIYFNASGINMPGGFVSNAGIDQSGHNNVFGTSTYVPPCTVNENGDTTDNKYNGVELPTTASAQTWPNPFAGFPSPCTYGPSPLTTPAVIAADASGTDLNLQNVPAGTTLPAGTYCYNSIEFNSGGIQGNVTFKAASFQLNASEPDFTPFYQGLLLYYTGSSTLAVDGTGNSYLTGGIYAPSATVNLNTPSGTIVNSFVESQAIIVNGGPFTWNSTLTTAGGPGTVSLTQ